MRAISTLFSLFLAAFALAQTPVIVKDIFPGTGSSFLDSKESPVSIGPIIYFSANDGTHGQELWRSDGTETGTYMVKDIRPDSIGSAPIRFTLLGDKILFFANDGTHGDELWVTDGTEAGTVLVKDVNPGPGSAIRRNYLPQERDRIVHNGTFYFAADTGPGFSQLWRSDGTEQGTQFVSDVCPGCNANNSATGEFAILNDTLFLEGGSKMWRSDGTTAGTISFVDNQQTGGPGLVRYLASVDGLLYMTGGTNSFSLDLWASDGTKVGTRLVKDFTDSGAPHFFTPFANRVFFFSDRNLWSTDGTEANTQMESQLLAENPNTRRNNMIVWKNELYFRARAADGLYYLYKTDGSTNGETQVYVQNFISTALSTPVFFATNEDYLFYDAYSNSPSIIGIVRVDSSGGITSIPVGTPVENLVIAENNLFFWTQKNNTTGKELWKLPLTTSATQNPANELAIKIYPTLSSTGIFYLELKEDEVFDVEVRVFDAMGKESRHITHLKSSTLDLGGLPNGMYWVRVATRNGKYSVRKLIIGQ